MNLRIKRIDFKHIFGGGKSKSIFPKTFKKMHQKELPYASTNQNFDIESYKSFYVSLCGQKVYGFSLPEDRERKYSQCKVLRFDFQTKQKFFYDYEHKDCGYSIEVSEKLNLLMTGANDGRAILHDLVSGKTVKIFELNDKVVYSLKLLGSFAVCGTLGSLTFIDLIAKKTICEKQNSSEREKIECIQTKQSNDLERSDFVLYVGSKNCKDLFEIILPNNFKGK